MAEEEGPQVKVEYLDGEEEESYNWAKRPGKVKITYVDGSTFEGTLNEERLKHGKGVYEWKKPGEEGEEEPVTKATYDGDYCNGKKQGLGKMVYPNGDIYQGEWVDNKVGAANFLCSSRYYDDHIWLSGQLLRGTQTTHD